MAQPSPDIYAIFQDAIGRDSAEAQAAYAAEACGDDVHARQRVEALLQAHRAAGDFFGGVPAGMTTTKIFSATDTLGSTIGPYRLREILGSGGMGIVYAAEQETPIRRHVALKVIKPGMDSREVLARFEAERQALALMDHPNIARVLEAGATDAGYPYFAMELVRGVPITDDCDHYRLSPCDRLQLFITVCRAVQHAHQKGILHRDLKPSNVLVARQGDVPVPKVIDFGVAKALNQRLTEQTLYTMQAQWLGTPLYMSPEQAEMSGQELNARSDVYALGVMLYELLTGSTPLDRERFSQVSYDELRRIIREDDPPRPSQRLSTLGGEQRTTVATRRNLPERELTRALRGDLDWIVMKALEKDRTRRYESAAALAEDVQRYLDHQPVRARPPSPFYRTGKLIRRQRRSILAGGLALAVVLLVINASSFVEGRKQGPDAPPGPNVSSQQTAPPLNPSAVAQKTETAVAPHPVADPRTDGAQQTIPPLAVLPFEEHGPEVQGFGNKISDYLIANLAVEPDLVIVERAELDKSLDEQKLSLSGFVRADEAVQVGRLTGAKLLVLGSATELDGKIQLLAKITSTETGRVEAASVRGGSHDDLAELADQLANAVLGKLRSRAHALVPPPMARVDRLAAIMELIGDKPLPKVWLQIEERHIGQQTIDPAAETELSKLLEDSGFTVIDHAGGNRQDADVIIEGEAFSELATRHEDLISVKARVEVTAVRRDTGERIASDRQTEIVVDLAEQVTGKTAMQNAAAEIASRLLPKLADWKSP